MLELLESEALSTFCFSTANLHPYNTVARQDRALSVLETTLKLIVIVSGTILVSK